MKNISLDEIVLLSGSHKTRKEGVCIMELVAWLADEPHTDTPKCTPLTIAAFLRNWNDSLDNTTRQKLKPYAPLVIGLTVDDEIEKKRAWLATDWLARVCAPVFLEVAGLRQHAESLKSLAPLRDTVSAKSALAALNAARKAARKAAWNAAGNAAWNAAGNAAWNVAGNAAGDAAWAAARAAVGAAAGAAAGEELKPTVVSLQVSAFSLLERMIAA